MVAENVEGGGWFNPPRGRFRVNVWWPDWKMPAKSYVVREISTESPIMGSWNILIWLHNQWDTLALGALGFFGGVPPWGVGEWIVQDKNWGLGNWEGQKQGFTEWLETARY